MAIAMTNRSSVQGITGIALRFSGYCLGVLNEMRFSQKTTNGLLIALVTIFLASTCAAQGAAADVVMVFPFENTSNRPEYNWVGESFADSIAELLNKPGLVIVSSDDLLQPMRWCVMCMTVSALMCSELFSSRS